MQNGWKRVGMCVGIGLPLLLSPLSSADALIIGTSSIANNAVTTPKIKNLAVTNAKIGNLAVTSTKIANGAVTPRKISSNSNVVVVAPSGGDFTNPVDALASITDASENKPYLVRLMPGQYDVGDRSVIMKPYVDLEGSGEFVTYVQGTVSTPFNAADDYDVRPLYGVVTMADESEVRFLTVYNTGAAAGSKCVAAVLSRDADASLSHVRAFAVGSNCNAGVVVNITQTDSGRLTLLRDVLAFAEGGVTAVGMAVRGSVAETSAAIMNCIAQAEGASSGNIGLNVMTAQPIVQGGVLMADGPGVNLALSGYYGLPTLQGVLIEGASDLRGNWGAATFNQCTMGPVSMTDGDLDIFGSAVRGPVTVNWSGGDAHVPVSRCAGTVRTDTLATLNPDCSTP
jgi:hypothetical protein